MIIVGRLLLQLSANAHVALGPVGRQQLQRRANARGALGRVGRQQLSLLQLFDRVGKKHLELISNSFVALSTVVTQVV